MNDQTETRPQISNWRYVSPPYFRDNTFVIAVGGKPGYHCELISHDGGLVHEIVDWMRDNLNGEHSIAFSYPFKVWIEDHEDALLFLLKWR